MIFIFRNEHFKGFAASIKQRVTSKELLLCTVLLTNVLTSTYFHKDKITINNCWSEWPSLRLTHARHKESDQIQHESRPNDTDTPQQAPYICQTPQQAGNTANYIYASNIYTISTIQLYTIYTSEAATTSRAPTQTADCSEAEESMDSDDNDDRLWQAVSGRGKKRTCPGTAEVPTMKKNKLQEIKQPPTTDNDH